MPQRQSLQILTRRLCQAAESPSPPASVVFPVPEIFWLEFKIYGMVYITMQNVRNYTLKITGFFILCLMTTIISKF
jgi:hypothetical protein